MTQIDPINWRLALLTHKIRSLRLLHLIQRRLFGLDFLTEKSTWIWYLLRHFLHRILKLF